MFYNIVQKRRVANSVNFRVHASKQQQIIRDLLRVDRDVLQDLLGKCEANPLYRPESDLANCLHHVLHMYSYFPGRSRHGVGLLMRVCRGRDLYLNVLLSNPLIVFHLLFVVERAI